MSREDAHKLLDKFFDMKLTGFFSLNFFEGGVTNEEIKIRAKQFLALAI